MILLHAEDNCGATIIRRYEAVGLISDWIQLMSLLLLIIVVVFAKKYVVVFVDGQRIP